jgi:hypothetical protein
LELSPELLLAARWSGFRLLELLPELPLAERWPGLFLLEAWLELFVAEQARGLAPEWLPVPSLAAELSVSGRRPVFPAPAASSS